MNQLERQMVALLKELKSEHGALAVRAEFEAEGTRLEDLLRLKEIAMTAGAGLQLKIGGCESVRDILEVSKIGVDQLVAPMIESAYALRKYLQAVGQFIAPAARDGIEILCNLETASAAQNLDEIFGVPEISQLKGVVVERVDLCFSLGRREDEIDAPEIGRLVEQIVARARAAGLTTALGGGLSANSLPFIRALNGRLDRFETRKVCFDCLAALARDPETGILKALGFELLWLRNKLGFNSALSLSDQDRIRLIEQQYWPRIKGLIS